VEEGPAEIFLGSLLILPGYQGRGLGTAVIRDVIGRAERLGLPVALQVLKVNPAIRLYQRLGFATVGETATHFLMRRE
jgi:GNAT superfamily N-acetyltransferase